MSKLVLWFVKITGYIPQLFYFRKKVYYVNKEESNRRIKGSAIIVSNHKRLFDFVLYMYLFLNRDIYTVIGEVMFNKGKLFSWFLKKIGGIKVERDVFDFGFLSKCVNLLNKGKVVEIFPEGRLPLKEETTLLEFKPSFVYLALESGAPIIPIYTNGSYAKKARTKVIIGEKIYAQDLYDSNKSDKENIDYICNYVKSYINNLGMMIDEEEKN
ncbi:MAG: 1-acyl-sn-glycerol-3-phosphate acyltransferase [Erysipelotrichaceae bacterium]|nr:1-acyl-sn-glycerol-3-phosphate acyltransferase [Erysipelotrichaceae bacterium]